MAYFAVPGVIPAMDALQDYSFEAQPGETVTWNVIRRTGDQGQVASGLNRFEAVVRAQKDQAQRLQTETSEMSQRQQLAENQLQILSNIQALDIGALNRAAAEKQSLAEIYEKDVAVRSGDFQALTVAAREKREETASRRRDVVRLRSELEELRTDVFQLEELLRILTDRHVRIELDNQQLQQRAVQLQRQLGT